MLRGCVFQLCGCNTAIATLSDVAGRESSSAKPPDTTNETGIDAYMDPTN